jgi:hypothetical protein
MEKLIADDAGASMATLQEMIVEKIIAELSDNKSLSVEKISALRDLLQRNAKVRADDLVKIFANDGGQLA